MTDWRLPENRREAFLRFYGFHLKHKAHPGMVYSWLPAIAEAFSLDEEGRAWLAWLNANTQNPVTSTLILEAAPTPREWRKAIDFWSENYDKIEFDTDRRYHKKSFGKATEHLMTESVFKRGLADGWAVAGAIGWGEGFKTSKSLYSMGRLSAWSGYEFARILLGGDILPDSDSLLLEDHSGSNSHRNGLAIIMGLDATYFKPGDAYPDDEEMKAFGEGLLLEASERFPGEPDLGYLTMESALCTYKSWHKPRRRYPGVYADMAFLRLRKAEETFGRVFDILWSARKRDLPSYMRLEDSPTDPGLSEIKQNYYLQTGDVPMMDADYPDMGAIYRDSVDLGLYGKREEQ